MQRRSFLASLAAGPLLASTGLAVDLPHDLRVTRIVGFDLVSRRSKFAGRNAFKDVHGDTARDAMVRIVTNSGLEGIGNCRATEADAAKLLGRDPFEFFSADDNAFVSPLARGTMPLWDLLGKVQEKPIHELLGGRGPADVPVYDGSIYFLDLLPQYSEHWADRLLEEIETSVARGHRAFKVKIGRGFKWMERRAGDERDIEVLKTFRKQAGADVLIGVDANNGYDVAGAKRLFEQIAPLDIAFAEEMFPEQVDQDLEFKDFLKSLGLETLVADGETQGELEPLKPFMDARAIDIYQGDMNRFGFEGILTEAAWARPQGLRVAPHNWGSLVGFFMQLHVGRAIDNLYRAEHDPLTSDVLVSEGYAIKEGNATVPDAPGAGLAIREDRFAAEAKVRYDLRA